MTTVGEIIELLSVYPKDMVINDEQNRAFIHIVNLQDSVILSPAKPIGYCNRSGEYVYPSIVDGYSAFCPSFDEDLFDMEWSPFEDGSPEFLRFNGIRK
jgi:hypothetical protein